MNGGLVILADEPTGALDSQGGREVMAILEKLHGQGHTIILVTHDSDIAAYAHRLVRIADGRVASVIALMAIGNGAKQDVVERIQAMGTDLLTIERGPPPFAPRVKSWSASCLETFHSSGVCPVSAWSIRKLSYPPCCALAIKT